MGRHRSLVQFLAIVMLTHLDTMTRYQHETQSFKLSMIASGKGDPTKLFPEYFPKEKTEVVDDGAPVSNDTPLDYSEVTWQSPKDADPEEFERLMAMINQGGAAMNGEQVTNDIEAEPVWTDWR